ncbi:MAG: response regulator [Acidimicrobiia bacterium]
MAEARLLVVEDEPAFADALTVGLQREGFEVAVSSDGIEAVDMFDAFAPDLVLLDVMLPGQSGLEVCRQLRAKSSVPIIMVTAKSSEIDSVVGLEVGADDYVTKPYRLRELVARIRAVLRRSDVTKAAVVSTTDDGPLRVGDLVVDVRRHEVSLGGQSLKLRLREFELLALLMENVGRVLTRELLMDRIWGETYVGDTKTLDVHIKRLREHIEDDPRNPVKIVTIRGLGYKYAG